MDERLAHQAAALIDLGQGADRRKVAGRHVQHVRQLREGLVEPVQFDEGAAEGDAGGQGFRMVLQAGAAHPHGFVVLAFAPEFLRQLGKRQRRRVGLDPASEF